MASYFLQVKIFSRGKGSSTTRAAAYRSGERIRDERSCAVHDYTDRTDVAHAEIVLPAEYAGHTDMEWALNRQVLWNAVQQSGRRWDARLAREVLVHLPPEMSRAQRVTLVRRLSHELADRYHSAVDFSVHEPRPQADERHHHAHILMTSRQVGPGGIGARTTLELSGRERHERGLGPSKEDLLWLRVRKRLLCFRTSCSWYSLRYWAITSAPEWRTTTTTRAGATIVMNGVPSCRPSDHLADRGGRVAPEPIGSGSLTSLDPLRWRASR